MPERIGQSGAVRVPLKAFLSDGVTEATGKTIAITISKNGTAFGNPSAGAMNATEIANGWYYVDLSATDTGILGPLVVRGTATGVDPTEITYTIVDFVAGRSAIADKILGRNIAGGSDGGRTVTQALRLLRNLRRLASGFLNVYREDDTTLDWQLPVTTAQRDPLERVG